MGRGAPTYLISRNDRHSVRFRVPVDLAARLGRIEIVRALGTRNGRMARLLAARIALRVPGLWTLMRDRPGLSTAELRRLANAWLRREIDREWRLLDSGEFARRTLPADLEDAEQRTLNADLFARDAALTEERLLRIPPLDRPREMDNLARQFLVATGHGDMAGSRERAELSVMLLERKIELQQSKQAWVEGNPGHLPPSLVKEPAPAGQAAAPQPPEQRSVASRSLGEAIDLFVGNMRQRKAKAKHIKDAMVDFRLLEEAFGRGHPVGKIGVAEAGRLWEALRSLPPRFRSRPELASLPSPFDKADKARELALEPMHHRTVDSYLARWRQLFQQEVSAGQVVVNPFDGKKATPSAQATRQQRTFTTDELESLFGSPLFQGAQSDHHRYEAGTHLINDWMFWAPLIALMSGARVGEIAQLRPRDIRKVGDYTVIDINDESGKSLKNQGTARRIPVHSRLVSLGLLVMAEQRQRVGHVLLLPGMPKPILDDPGAPASKWMSGRLLPRLELKNRLGLGFHSFRHTLKTLLRSAEVPDSVSNFICGHDERSSGVGAKYGQVELEAMSKAIEKITLPSAVLRLTPRFDTPPAVNSEVEAAA
jgi:integrase